MGSVNWEAVSAISSILMTVATFAAIVASLWIANRASSARIKLSFPLITLLFLILRGRFQTRSSRSRLKTRAIDPSKFTLGFSSLSQVDERRLSWRIPYAIATRACQLLWTSKIARCCNMDYRTFMMLSPERLKMATNCGT